MTRYRRRSELWLAALRRLVLPSDHTMTTNLLNLTHTTQCVLRSRVWRGLGNEFTV